MSSTVTSKGQITLPIEIRQRLGLRKGDKVDFIVEGGRTFLQPLREEENPFLSDVGLLPEFGTIEEINAWIREMRGGGPEFPD